jgi:hypothetical protein
MEPLKALAILAGVTIPVLLVTLLIAQAISEEIFKVTLAFIAGSVSITFAGWLIDRLVK